MDQFNFQQNCKYWVFENALQLSLMFTRASWNCACNIFFTAEFQLMLYNDFVCLQYGSCAFKIGKIFSKGCVIKMNGRNDVMLFVHFILFFTSIF